MRAANKRNITVLALVVFLAAIALWRSQGGNEASLPAFQQQNAAQPDSGSGAGQQAPSFTLTGENGSSYAVGGPREKALLLNFWASWCDPCKQEAPELNAMALKYKDVLDIYGVNVTSQDYKPNAERFIKKFSLTFPVLFDLKGEVFAEYNGAAFPTNVLIDKNGVISEVVLGLLTPEELEEKIIALTQP